MLLSFIVTMTAWGTKPDVAFDDKTNCMQEHISQACDEPEGDSDSDGTVDSLDPCPTIPNESVNNNDGDRFNNDCDNCPLIANDDQANNDGDIAGDLCDACPDDFNKVLQGICGCGISDDDSDGDQTPNCQDACDNDPNKIEPGICGCGVPDNNAGCDDLCPDDPNKLEPGVCGCGNSDVDTDLDLTPDCNDECPNDPNKIEPGICGCGVPNNNEDCDDLCPNDPNKLEPGVCGCGNSDVDTDLDLTPDCNDECPDDPNKISPRDCGCNVSESSCKRRQNGGNGAGHSFLGGIYGPWLEPLSDPNFADLLPHEDDEDVDEIAANNNIAPQAPNIDVEQDGQQSPSTSNEGCSFHSSNNSNLTLGLLLLMVLSFWRRKRSIHHN